MSDSFQRADKKPHTVMFHKWPLQKKYLIQHFPLTRAVSWDQNLTSSPHVSVTELLGALGLAKLFAWFQLVFLTSSTPPE